MAVVHSKVNSDHCSTSIRQTQHLGGERIQRVFRLQRMANRPSNDSALHQRVHHRPVCLTPKQSSPTICQLETRPRRYLQGHDDPGLGSSKRLRLSTVQSDFSSPEKSIPGQSGCGLSDASVAGTALVNNPSGSPNGEHCNDPQLQAAPKRPCSPSTCTPDVPQAPSSRLSHIRENHQAEGFSEDVTKILPSATRQSTHKSYQSSWRIWCRWCCK